MASIGSPFGDRPPLADSDKGTPNVDQWFRGDAAPFAGVEYKINDRWTFKAEYSSDAYVLEDDEPRAHRTRQPVQLRLRISEGPECAATASIRCTAPKSVWPST